MVEVTKERVLEALKAIQDPDKNTDIVSLDMVKGLAIKDSNVAFAIEVEPERGGRLEPLRQAAEKAVMDLEGVTSATVVLTAQSPQSGAAPAKAGLSDPDQTPAQNIPLIPGIKHVVAVASGKGGVGKSTTAVNLAVALHKRGHLVGILDADIYGPSLPRMMGVTGNPGSKDGRTFSPLQNFGVKVMSMGFLVPDDVPMIWRGPMVMQALEQMLRDVDWGTLDVLVVDLPPGTGDAQLTMSQRVPLAGAVIVSTPQDIALIDARKGLNMFRKVEVPVLGIVENMSTFICPKCGERSDIFGHGGAQETAKELEADFLGEIPLHMDIRETSDSGAPIVLSKPDGPHAEAYLAIADKVWAKLSGGPTQRQGPRIVTE